MRGKRASKRKLNKDPKFESETIEMLVNYVMLHGEKAVARKAVYGALESASKTLKKGEIELLDQALSNVMPVLEVRSRRVGGANYQVPVPVPEDRQVTLALRWIISIARSKKGKDFQHFLAEEIINAYKGEGDAVKKKEDTEKMAEANKAFAHFRW
ncbi:MAG: 30S ribosomal protein S7 [bacterium]